MRFYLLIPTPELDQNKPTKAKVRAVINKVSKWHILAQSLQTTENISKATEMLEDLQKIMLGIGAKLNDSLLNPEGMSNITTYVMALKSSFQEASLVQKLLLCRSLQLNKTFRI